MTDLDTVIRGGDVYDGTGAKPIVADVGIRDGKVVAVDPTGLPRGQRTIDATGKWVIPGMIDVHTHYDAEVLGNPGLGETARHGVTSILMGNCSLSTVYADPEDCADMFARVEALPWDVVNSAVKEHKDWSDPKSYVESIASRPLGVNVAAFIGHSDIRVATMGLRRAVDAGERPTPSELDQMSRMLEDALDAGFVGLSTIRSSFSKLEGVRYPARQLPSTYATWAEYRKLNSVLRQRNRVHQSTPNLTSPAEIWHYLAQSAGRVFGRRALKTTLISAADIKADRNVVRAATAAAHLANKLGGADFRWQHLPVPFEVYADGIDLVIFEEFGSGAAALNLRDEIARGRLLADEEYRRWFRKDIAKRFGMRIWHRDLYDAEIVACPDTEVVGKSFGEVGEQRGIEPADALLDLVVEHGSRLRWRTTIANDRDDVLDRCSNHRSSRSVSPTRVRICATWRSTTATCGILERVYRRGFMPIEAAVHRVTGELADWYGLDAGRLVTGQRADIAVIDPVGFDGSSGVYAEAPMPGTEVSRMVNRNDRAVAATIVGGQLVYEYGTFADGFGTTLHAGTFLAA